MLTDTVIFAALVSDIKRMSVRDALEYSITKDEIEDEDIVEAKRILNDILMSLDTATLNRKKS